MREPLKSILKFKRILIGFVAVMVVVIAALIICIALLGKKDTPESEDISSNQEETMDNTVKDTAEANIDNIVDDTTEAGTDNTLDDITEASTEETENVFVEINVDEEYYTEPVIWYEDLTHDGINERVEVDLNGLNALADPDKKTVTVYSGESDELIWSGHADEVHIGWNGYYIYHNPEDGQAYLLMWQPYMCTGMGEYKYRLFSLSEDGEEQIAEEEVFEFYETSPKEEDAVNIEKYLDRVNEFLRESYVLIDTDNGEAFYSEQDEPKTREFDAAEIVYWLNYFYGNPA